MNVGGLSGTVRSGLLAQLVADSTATQTQMNKLTQQSASGRVADSYGGLGSAAPVSIDLRPQMAQVQAWQQNIGMANTTLDTTQNVLGQLESIATSFSSQTLGVAMQSVTGATAVAAQAQVTLQQVLGLLNTQVGGQYVFAGADSANPPVDATALDNFVATASTQVAGLNTGTTPAAVVGSLVGTAGTANFTYLPGAAPAQTLTQTGDGQSVPTAFVMGSNSFPPPAIGGTGSYVRDLIAGLAGLAGLNSTTASESTLQAYGAGISQLLQGAAGAIANDQAGFGQVQANLASQGTALSDTLTSLTKQVSGAEDVDMTATATALSQVQTQLQASYQLIAGLKQLSLTAYL